jgi:hypothetical protein
VCDSDACLVCHCLHISACNFKMWFLQCIINKPLHGLHEVALLTKHAGNNHIVYENNAKYFSHGIFMYSLIGKCCIICSKGRNSFECYFLVLFLND